MQLLTQRFTKPDPSCAPSYTGRTQHIHVAVLSSNGTEVLPNGTVYQNVATHVGQVCNSHALTTPMLVLTI